MAHSLKPNTTYSIVTMEVAVPCTDSAELADWINETLRPLAVDGQIADYSLRGLRDVREYTTGDDPEEGEWTQDSQPRRLAMFMVASGDQVNNMDLLCLSADREGAIICWREYYGTESDEMPDRVFTLPSNFMDQIGAVPWPDMACWNPNVKPIR